MNRVFRVGVIGTGAIAKIAHFPVLASRTDVKLTGVMALHKENAVRAQAQYGFQHAVDRIEDLIDLEPDCVFVLSPKGEHFHQVMLLLEKGIDVFCEKPLAMTLREAAMMAEASVKAGKRLMVGFNRRFAPVYKSAKDVYCDSAPDVIIAQKNRPTSEYRATLENAIHMVDLMRHFCGECVGLHAHAKFLDPYYETSTTAQLEFENGTAGILVANRSSGQWGETLEMHGGNHSVFVNSPDSVTVTDNQQSHTISMTPLAMGWAGVEDKLGFRAEIDHFFNCLVSGENPITSAEDAYKTHELMHRILLDAGLPALD